MLTNFPNGISSFGVPVLGGIGGIPFTGNYYFVNPVTGADGNPGTVELPLQTLYAAHAKMTSGNNDVCILIGNGQASGSARLSLANAQSVNSAATSGTLNWTKSACHLIGVAAPTSVAQRARIAPPTGTYTQATFGSGNFVVVSGSGCYFANFSLFNGFSTGGTNQICWTDTGGRNYYENVEFGGMGDSASASDSGSRSLKVGSAGSGESTFVRCTIGLDTVARSTTNASLELAGATPRNRFVECIFPFQTSNAGVLGIVGTGNACVDRWNSFERCLFLNNISSTSTQMTALASFSTSSPGGFLVFKDCDTVGITKLGGTNALANSYVTNVGGASTGGLDVNPS